MVLALTCTCTLVSRFTHLFQSCSKVHGVSIIILLLEVDSLFSSYYSVTGRLPMATVIHLVVFVNA